MLCVHKDPKIGGVRETMLATVRGHDRAVSHGDHPSDRPMILLLELVVQMHNMSSGNHRAAKLARLQDPSPRRPPRRATGRLYPKSGVGTSVQIRKKVVR